VRIEQLSKRVKDLEDINDGHRKLNQELRKELQYYKEKSSKVKVIKTYCKVIKL
jgi:hypothetical protein